MVLLELVVACRIRCGRRIDKRCGGLHVNVRIPEMLIDSSLESHVQVNFATDYIVKIFLLRMCVKFFLHRMCVKIWTSCFNRGQGVLSTENLLLFYIYVFNLLSVEFY